MVSKAPHLLLEALRRLPPGTATVDLFGTPADYHGDDSYRTVLEPLLASPGVHLHGPQPHDRVAAVLKSLDALVVPSVWPETSPLVIREAFLAGRPVVASNIGGIPELIDHERNGLLFEPGDVEGLAHALQRLAGEPGLLDRLKAGAAATPVRSIEDDAAASRRLYESLAKPGSARPEPATGSTPPRLAAIVLNYRTAADTAIAVASLMASDRPIDDVIVVDNDEGRECQDALARWGDRVTYLRTGTNLGFAGGMNVGIRRALDGGAARILLVNSDVVVPPDCLERLEAAMAGTGAGPATRLGAGIAGPLIMSRSVPDLIGSAGIAYNIATGRMRHRMQRDDDADVDAVSGCVMLIRKEVFERIGLLDERFFFSFEEIDFCLRARAAGFPTRLAADAVAYHEGGKSIGPHSARRLYFAARNHLALASQHANGDGPMKRGGRSLFIAMLNLAHAVKAPGGSLGARLGATLRGIRDYLVNAPPV